MDRKQAKKTLSNMQRAAKANGVKKERMSREEYKGAVNQGELRKLSHSREIHKGHFHKEKTVDEGGVISRQLGTVKPNDNYEIMNGWTLSKKELYALEYDSDKLVAEWHV